MIIKGIVINIQDFTIRDIEYEVDEVDDKFYVREIRKSSKEGANILFAAYCFPEHNKDAVIKQLEILKEAKKNYDNLVANVYYKVFPTLR